MKMKSLKWNLFFLCIICGVFHTKLIAQQNDLSSQYVVNKLFLSPAYAGAGDNFETYGTYRKNWMGIDGAPETKYISANGIIHKNMGLGGNVSSYQAGIFTNLNANLNYAYHAHLNGSSYLSLGLGFGMVENHLDLSGKTAQNDPVVLSSTKRTSSSIDASFGIAFRTKNLKFGVSVPSLLTQSEDASRVYYLSPLYQGHAAYLININRMWNIEPTGIISQAKNAPIFYEIALPINYQNKIWLTPIYKKSSFAIGLGVSFFNNFIMNYSFEFSSKGIAGQSSGTHEITIGWKFNKKKDDLPAPDSKKPYYQWLNK
jgi:type IX secretion system PorP/SprF family membrane protein